MMISVLLISKSTFSINRNRVLIFKTPQTESVVSSLSNKHISEWTFDDYAQLIKMYHFNTKKTIQAEYLFDETYTKRKFQRNHSVNSFKKNMSKEAYFDRESGKYLILDKSLNCKLIL